MSRNLWLLVVVLGWAVFLAGCDSKKAADAGGGAAATAEKGAAASGGGAGAGAAGAGGGAGAGAAPAGTSAPTEMLALLPEDTIAVVYIPSLKNAEDATKRVVEATAGPEQAGEVKIDDALKKLGLVAADLDLTRGAAVAMTLGKDSPEPDGTAIIPVRDEKGAAAKVKAKMPGATVEASGGFAAINMKGNYKRGGIPAALSAPLPQGDAIIRVNVAALAKVFGPMFFEKAGEAAEAAAAGGGEAAAAMTKSLLDGMKAAVDATSVCDIAVRVNGTAVELDLTLVFADRSKASFLDVFAKSDLSKLARGLPEGGMMDFAAGIDFQRVVPMFSEFLKSSLNVYPPADRAKMEKMLEKMPAMLKSMGRGMVASASFSGGMNVTAAIDTADGSAYLRNVAEVYSQLDMKEGAITMSPVEDKTVEGAKVKSWKMKIDPDKLEAPAGGNPERMKATFDMMFGKDGMAFNVADLGNRVLFVIGGDEPLKAAIKSAKAESQSSVSKALAAAGPDAVGYLRYDLHAVMQMAAGMMKGEGKALKVDTAGEPVNLVAILNAGADRIRLRLSADPAKIMKMVKEMSK